MDPALAMRCEVVHAVERALPAGLRQRALRMAYLMAGLLRGRPMWATDFLVPAFALHVEQFLRVWKPDVVQVEFQVMAQYLPRQRAVSRRYNVVLTVPDPGASFAQERLREARGWRRIVAAADALAWRWFERHALARADAVVTFTERDAAALRGQGAARVTCIPLGFPLPEAALNPLGADPPSVLFAGSYAHPPNVDAALWLEEDIFPRVRERHPHSRLVLVGPDPPPGLSRDDAHGVTITGWVPDVRPYLDAAAVVVVPVRQGGGMRVKALEALASGKAVVATPLAVAGLDVADGEHVLLAQTSGEFADNISRLLEDFNLRSRLASSARAWALANLGNDRTAVAYDVLYQSLRGDRTPGAAAPGLSDVA